MLVTKSGERQEWNDRITRKRNRCNALTKRGSRIRQTISHFRVQSKPLRVRIFAPMKTYCHSIPLHTFFFFFRVAVFFAFPVWVSLRDFFSPSPRSDRLHAQKRVQNKLLSKSIKSIVIFGLRSFTLRRAFSNGKNVARRETEHRSRDQSRRSTDERPRRKWQSQANRDVPVTVAASCSGTQKNRKTQPKFVYISNSLQLTRALIICCNNFCALTHS